MGKQIQNCILISLTIGLILTLASFGIQENNSPLGYPKVSAGYPRPYFRDAGGVSVEGSLGPEDYFSLGDFLINVIVFALAANAIIEITQQVKQRKS